MNTEWFMVPKGIRQHIAPCFGTQNRKPVDLVEDKLMLAKIFIQLKYFFFHLDICVMIHLVLLHLLQ